MSLINTAVEAGGSATRSWARSDADAGSRRGVCGGGGARPLPLLRLAPSHHRRVTATLLRRPLVLSRRYVSLMPAAHSAKPMLRLAHAPDPASLYLATTQPPLT
jgi:hypothetical protein